MQDFTRKIAIAVRKNLPSWQAFNTVGHIAAYLGNKMPEAFDTGECFTTSDGISYPRNSQYPIIILSADHDELRALLRSAQEAQLLCHAFIREMIEFGDDSALEAALRQKMHDALEYLGVGCFGEKRAVDQCTKQLRLWK